MARWPFRRRRKQPRYRSGSPNRVKARHNPMKIEAGRITAELEQLGIVAAGELVTHGQATYLRRLIMPWQIRAFGYYDLLGEIKYASQFYSRALANLELYAAEKDDETGEMKQTENQVAIDALARIKDPGGGGRTGLLADYGRLMFLVGEALLFVWREEDDEDGNEGMERWEMLSTDELRLLDGSYTRFMAPTLPAHIFQPAPDDAFKPVNAKEAVAYRLHRRHPRFSALSDSTMEGALDICEELVLLTQVVRARVRSRLAGAGVLFLDDRITTRPDEPTPDEDPLEDPFIEDFTEAAMAPISDEGTASAVVPLIARVKVPDGMKLSDLVYHLQIVDPLQIYPETGLRMECIRRLAIVLDMPPEVLLGVATVNHWGAWMIDEQSWKVHLQPVAQGLVEDLTSAYFQPYLKKLGLEDWDKYYIHYDASKVINHPDRTSDGLKFHDAGLIGDKSAREAGGWDENDKPTEEEMNRHLGVKIRDASLAVYGEPSKLGTGGVEVAPGEIISTQGDATASQVTQGPPPSGPNEPGDQSVAAALMAAQIEGAAQFALIRAREAAGSRLRTSARRDNDAFALIDGRRNREVAPLLGRARVRTLIGGSNEEQLVTGARDLILDALRVFGVDDPDVATAVADTIERHAVRTLYDERPQPLPEAFRPFVVGLLTAAKTE